MQKKETVKEFQKSQAIRLADVFLLAPFLVYAGTRKSNLPDWIRVSLIGTGIATFIYNGNNYLKNLNAGKQ